MTHYPRQSVPTNDANAPLPPWRRGRLGADDRQTSLQFWLTMLVLGCVTLAGMTWGASNLLAQKGSEKLLRVDLLLPKLKSIHWERNAGAALHLFASAATKALPKERNPTAPHVPPPLHGSAKVTVHETPPHGSEPVTHAPLPALPPIEEACDEPAAYRNPCTPQRGDSPMIRNWKTLTMYSLLTAAAATLAPPPLLMAGDETKGKDPLEKLTKQVTELTASVNALTTRIGQMEKKSVVTIEDIGTVLGKELQKLERGKLADLDVNLKAVKTRVDEVKGDTSALQTKQLEHKLQIDNHKVQIDFLMDQIKNLQKLAVGSTAPAGPASPAVDKTFMEDLRSYMKKVDETQASIKNLTDAVAKLGPTEVRKSMFPANAAPAPNYGELVFNNMYSGELGLIVNGVNYRMPALTRSVIRNIPAGTVRYEVFADRFGLVKTETVTIPAGGSHVLDVFNRP